MGQADTESQPLEEPAARSGVLRVLRGPSSDPWWARPGFIAVVVTSAALYAWALDASGFGNEYYAAAAYSGSMDWTAWLFGSVDTASFISVDKPPLSLWVTGLSVRTFGLSSWSVLLPHALAGVATVAVLHHSVRRWHGHAAALGAAGALALTPIAVVMFRYNNPDALLTLLMTSSLALAYSAARRGSALRLAGSGALVGLAFLAKTNQALLAIPAIAVVYLVAAPVSLRRRLLHGAGAVLAAAFAAGWWILLAETSDSAPYFGQTDTGSFLDYVLGYNGLGRVSGDGVGPQDPFGGSGGWVRLFNTEVADQASWLIPLAVLGLAYGLWRRRRRPRTDQRRAGWLLWGTALAVHVAVFSTMSGVFHPYYVLTMAPAVAALSAAGVVVMWRAFRNGAAATWLLPAGIAVTGLWGAILLGRSPEFLPGLDVAVAVVAVGAAAVMLAVRAEGATARRVAAAALVIGLATVAAGPAAYSIDAIGTDYSGGDPKAGPGETGLPGAAAAAAADLPGGSVDGDAAPGGGLPPLPSRPPDLPAYTGALPAIPDRADRPAAPGDDRPQDGGGPPGRTAIPDGMVTYLEDHRGSETWIVAVQGSQLAAPLILETGEAVMAMGGFSGGDPTPTADELAGYVASGELRFVLVQGDAGRWRVVTTMCDAVDPADYGGGAGAPTLYDCAA